MLWLAGATRKQTTEKGLVLVVEQEDCLCVRQAMTQ